MKEANLSNQSSERKPILDPFTRQNTTNNNGLPGLAKDSLIQRSINNQAREHAAKDKGVEIQSTSNLPGGVKDSLIQRSINDQSKDIFIQSKVANENSSKMPSAVQAKMENSFGTDFSEVNIHQGNSATAMNALAYTQGSDIHFAPGKYNPESQSGQELLGHELTHVVQQRSGRVQPTTQLKGVGLNDDKGLEKEADVVGKNVAANANITNPVEEKSEVPTIVLPEVSSSLNFSVGASNAKYKEQLINFSADVRLVQNRLKEIGLLLEKDYTNEYPKTETVPNTIINTNTNTNTNTDINSEKNQSDLTQDSNVNTDIELTETEKLMLSVYQKIGKGPQVLSSSIPNTIESIKIFQREVKLGKVIDGRIDVGATSNLLLSISKAEVIKCRENYKLKKKQEEEQNKKELERIQKEEASRKWEEERIKGLKEAPTDDESIEKIIDKFDDESELACLLRDYAEYNPTLVIKVLEASDYSDQDDIVMEMMKIIDDNLLAKFSSELLNKMKECLDEGWTDKAEKAEINRISNVTSSTVNKEEQNLKVLDFEVIKKSPTTKLSNPPELKPTKQYLETGTKVKILDKFEKNNVSYVKILNTRDSSQCWILKSCLVDSAVTSAIYNASIKTNINYEYLMAVSYQESGFDPNIKASTSSATGLFQFINSTWLGMIKNYGAKHGLEKYSESIEIKKNEYIVKDNKIKTEILELKTNPYYNALMGALFQAENEAQLEKALSRSCKPTDLYLAHFLGANGAIRFLKGSDNDLGVDVVDEDVAYANAYIFYKKPKSFEEPKTVKEIYQFFTNKIESKMELFK